MTFGFLLFPGVNIWLCSMLMLLLCFVVLALDLHPIQGPKWVLCFWSGLPGGDLLPLSGAGCWNSQLLPCDVVYLSHCNFAAMEWLLSHCRYKSACVGFLYTLVFKLPSPLMVTRVSKNGMDPSLLLASFVNWILLSILLMWLKKLSSFFLLDDNKSIINKSSPKSRGVWCCVDSFFFKSIHIQISYYGAQW